MCTWDSGTDSEDRRVGWLLLILTPLPAGCVALGKALTLCFCSFSVD